MQDCGRDRLTSERRVGQLDRQAKTIIMEGVEKALTSIYLHDDSALSKTACKEICLSLSLVCLLYTLNQFNNGLFHF